MFFFAAELRNIFPKAQQSQGKLWSTASVQAAFFLIMKRINLICPLFLLLTLLSVTVAGAQRGRRITRQTASAPDRQTGDESLRRMEAEVLDLVNTHRRKLGLQALQPDSNLTMLARQHSQNMASGRVSFGHDGFSARSKTYGKTVGVFVGGMAENVAYNSENAGAVMENWLKSAGHRTNIEGDYKFIGIGIARNPSGNLYFTQIFANR